MKMSGLQLMSFLIKKGYISLILEKLFSRFWSKQVAFGTRYDLSKPWVEKQPKISLKIEPGTEEQISALLGLEGKDLDSASIFERLRRIKFHNLQIPTCHIVLADGKPCAMIWIIDHTQNNKIENLFKGSVPVLKNDEILMEFGFTHEDYRGCGLLTALVLYSMKKAKEAGKKHLIGFFRINNVGTNKVFKRLGFHPFIIREDKWLLFKRSLKFRSPTENEMDMWNN